MEIILLESNDVEKDRDVILGTEIDNVIFVVDNKLPLCEYIDKLNLSGANQFRIKICQELKKLDVFLPEKSKCIHCFSDLLKELNPSKKQIIVVRGGIDNDEEKAYQAHIQVSDIVQQLIYLNLPLSTIQVMTEKESEDIERVQAFEKNIQAHIEALNSSINKIANIKEDVRDCKKKISDSLEKIKIYFDHAQENELKIAVAASKKSGKSVVVNSMIECEAAPTSLELATPNNCIYKRIDGSKFTLDYEIEHYVFDSDKEIKEYIYNLFKMAEKNTDNGLAISDMHIGYPSDKNKNEFYSYTIYDTPGPDLAGADGHKEAAERAINEADVIIFTIDYSKYLTDGECNYLQRIKELFDQNQKRYSLIMNVNKLDLRYSSKDDKNVVRILDFIKNKLIGIDPKFRSSVVVGTSALTYYNSIAAPRIDDCECLYKSGSDFADNLDKCVEKYCGTEEMTILDQVQDTIKKAKNFHKIPLQGLDDIKNFSGMPNLLGYVKYIATNKARTEKLNNIIYHIQEEYCNIQNIFHYKELEESLINNKDKLEEAKKILGEFTDSVKDIFDDEYNDLYYAQKDGKLKSSILNELAAKRPVSLEEMFTGFSEKIDGSFKMQETVNAYVTNDLPTSIFNKLNMLYNSESVKSRKDPNSPEKKIKVVDINEVMKVYESCVSKNDFINYIITYFKTSLNDLSDFCKHECNNIIDDLTDLMNDRIKQLKNYVGLCKQKLNEECNTTFNLAVPEMKFEFITSNSFENIQLDLEFTDVHDGLIKNKNKLVLSEFVKYSDNWFVRLGQKSLEKIKGNDKLITLENARNIYTNAKIATNIQSKVLFSSQLNEVISNVKKEISDNVNQFTDYIVSESEKMQKSVEIADEVRKSIDHTTDYEKNIEKLYTEKTFLNVLKAGMGEFAKSWEN